MAKIKDETENLEILRGGTIRLASDGNQASLLEAFPNKFPDRPYIINIIFPEFTSLCPVTGQPDFGTIIIDYIPNALCVESKSLKLYMFSFRNLGSFMETITNSILDDLNHLLEPCWMRVQGLFVPRGGTRINVFAETSPGQIPEKFKIAAPQAIANWRAERHYSFHTQQ